MTDTDVADVADMADRAAAEIENLRNMVAELRPRAEAYDTVCAILGLLPKPVQGYGEDMAWRLRKQAADLRKPKDQPHGQ